MNREIRLAYEKVWQAQRDRDSLIAKTYPLGSTIQYTHGDNVIEAEVLWISGERIKVRGARSGKEYFVDAFRLVDTDKNEA